MFFKMYRVWRRWSVLRKTSLVLLALFSLHGVIGFLILPWIIKDQIQKKGHIAFGRQVEVEDVFINPYLFRARITGLKVHGLNEAQVIMSFSSLSGTVHWLPLLFTQTLKFSTIQLENPQCHLVRYPDGLLNISDLLGRNMEERPAVNAVKAADSFVNLAFSDVSVTGGALFIEDQVKSLSHEITDITFGLPAISDHQDQINELVTPQFSAVVNGTLLDFSGESTPFSDNHATGVEFTCKDLDISVINPYLPEFVPFVLTKGELDFSLKVGSVYVPDGKRLDLSLEGDLRLHDVIVDDKAGARFATAPSIDISIQTADFFTQAMQLSSVKIYQPELYLVRQKDGTMKYASLLVTTEKDDTVASRHFLAECEELALVDATLVVVDHVPSLVATHSLEKVNLILQKFSTAADNLFDFDLNLIAEESGYLQVSGQGGLSPLQLKAQGELRHFPLTIGQNYIAEQSVVVLTEGTVFSTFSAAGGMDKEGLSFQVTAEVQVEDLVVLEGKGKPEVVGVKSLQVEVFAKNKPYLLKVKKINLDNPRAHVELQKNGGLNVASLVKEQEDVKEPEAEVSQDPLALLGKDGMLELGLLTVTNGQLFVVDRSISPSYHVDITEIDGTVNDVSTLVDEGGAVHFKALFDHHSPLVMTGQVNPFPPNRFFDIDMAFSDIEMSPFSPYSQKFIGRDLTKGKLSVKQEIKVKNRALDVDTNIYLDQLGLGTYQANETATGLPVGLAVALLQDRHGVISFDVPIEGRLDDPEFGVGGAVVSVLANLVTKAATSPFSLIGSMFSGDGESQFIVFSTGKTGLDPEQQDTLTAFAKVLYDRPGLKVEIGSQYDAAGERAILLQSKFMAILQDEKLQDQAGSTLGAGELAVGTEEYSQYLVKAYKNAEFKRPRNLVGILEEQTPIEMERMLKTNIEVTPGEMRLLAMQRGEAVAALLRENGPVESERLFVLEPTLLDTGSPQVELRLQ